VPGRFLTDAERARLTSFPEELAESDLTTYYTLSTDDLAVIRRRRGDSNRIGFALQLCTLRFLGFIPDEIAFEVSDDVVAYLAAQLEVDPLALAEYAEREQTRTDHLTEAMQILGFRSLELDDLVPLGKWLLERALEHDKPTLLFELAAEHLRAAKVVRPGVTVLERAVSSAREQAEKETHHRLASLLTPERAVELESLLVHDPKRRHSPFAWLCRNATSWGPVPILAEIEKLRFVQRLGADTWDLRTLNPNRIKFLAQLARRSTAQALQRSTEERRMSTLVCFLYESVWQLVDEIVDLFDRTLFHYHATAGNELDKLKQSNGRAANEKVVLFARLARVLLDDSIADGDVRAHIYRELPREKLSLAADEADEIARPLDDSYFDFLLTRYSRVRVFAPAFLDAIEFRSNGAGDAILEGVEALRRLNREQKRRVPDDAPLSFVPVRWRPYVVDDQGAIHRAYWELCLLSELRSALRSGDVWIPSSRRYANPQSYLIPSERWPEMQKEACTLLGASPNGAERLAFCAAQIEGRLSCLEQSFARGAAVRIEDGQLVVGRIEAEPLPEESIQLQELMAERLPRVELAELLIEVDGWCGLTEHLTHAGGAKARTRELRTHLFASILAHACNFNLSTMAQVAGLSPRQLAWTAEWYLREETLQAAANALVNYQHRLPLAIAWGGGTLSSSDGQRFPVAVKSTTASSIPRYFGFGRGLTFYTWTSDQFSQFGTKVISSTVRDATYVLDGLLDNQTELPIVEHTTDTTGYTDLVFALFDLLGLQFSPRIRDLADQRLYRMCPVAGYPNVGPFLRTTINQRLILEHWDDLLRVAASLKMGWVTASLLISRLQASPRQNALTKALQEYGRIAKTMFVLRFLESEEYRRRIGAQLNKGESLHALRAFLFFAEEGRIRRRNHQEQTHQAHCLNLLTNAVVTWNTVYEQAVLRQLHAEGHTFGPEAVAHLSPAMYGHINRYGKYRFDLEPLASGQLRPLRQPAPAIH
jgi:TnpA family transposase